MSGLTKALCGCSVLWSLLGSVAASQQTLPAACSRDVALVEGTTNVHMVPGEFNFEGRTYPYKIWSAWAFSPGTTQLMCLRYEIENTGSETIEQVRWPEGGLEFLDLKPGKPLGVSGPEFTDYERPDLVATSVKAFVNTVGSGAIYRTVEQRNAVMGKKLKFVSVNTQDLLPGLFRSLNETNLRPLRAVGFESYSGESVLPNLTSTITTPDGTLVFTSSASSVGSEYTIAAHVEAQEGISLQVYNPFDQALSKASKEGKFTLKNLQVFSDALAKRDFGAVNVNNAGSLTSLQSDEKSPWSFSPIFAVRYPISIESSAGVMCASVQAYSPIPVSFGDDLCVKK